MTPMAALTTIEAPGVVSSDPKQALSALLEHAAVPVVVDALVPVFARLWGMEDKGTQSIDAGHDLRAEGIDAGEMVDNRRLLERVWSEVKDLPVQQRAALLLSMRLANGISALVLFRMTAIATLREIASVLGLPAEEIAKLWGRLPLNDAELAERLGATRQQVINMRLAARQRLGRRLNR